MNKISKFFIAAIVCACFTNCTKDPYYYSMVVGPADSVESELSWEGWKYIYIGTLNSPQPSNMYFVDDNTGYIIFHLGKIMKTINGGVSFEDSYIDLEDDERLRKIHFYDANCGLVVGQNGVIISTTDGGASWQRLEKITSQNLCGVECVSPNKAYAIGSLGTLIRITNNEKVAQVKLGTSADIMDISFADENIGYVISSDSLFKTTDGGTTWTGMGLPPFDGEYSDISFPENGDIGYLVGDVTDEMFGGPPDWLLKTTDAGETWTKVYTEIRIGDICFLNSDVGYIINNIKSSSRFVLAKTTDGGESWDDSFISNYHFSYIQFTSPLIGYVLENVHGSVAKTIDGGQPIIND